MSRSFSLLHFYMSMPSHFVPDGVAFHQYAYDTQLYCRVSTANFNNDVEEWFLRNGMLLNADKSDVDILSTGQQAHKLPNNPVVNVAVFAIKSSDSTRSLGVVIDDRLTFNKQVSRAITTSELFDTSVLVCLMTRPYPSQGASCCQDLTIVIHSFLESLK